MITYNIASYERPTGLIKTIESIFDQCDRINVALNSYKSIPVELYDKKIAIFVTNNDKGDAYKFIQLSNSDGYFFTVDDDIVYPRNYTKYMIDAVEKYNRKAIITLHGRKYTRYPITSMFETESKLYHFNENVIEDAVVDIGGTGVMCFHTDLMKLPLDHFEIPNMADIWVAKWAKENRIKIICASHSQGYVKAQPFDEQSIYITAKSNDTVQTEIINSMLFSEYNS